MKSEPNFLRIAPEYEHTAHPFAKKVALRVTAMVFVICCSASAIAKDSARVNVVATGARIRHFFETGQASWYGLKFQGRKTATGEKFDMNALTCAHRSLPLGSWIRVTNVHNRKSVLVRVNDRGPMVDDRIIDLSFAAAHVVGLSGIGRVKLERVSLNDPEVAHRLIAQLPPFPVMINTGMISR